MHTNQTIRQQRHAAKAIENQIMQTLNQKTPVSTKEYLHQSLVAVRQQEEAKKKKKMERKITPK